MNKFDALIVLGLNISPFLPKRYVREAKDHLSPLARINVLAAAHLYKMGYFNTFIFSTGQTVGTEMPSEAYSLYEFMIKKFPELTTAHTILEDKSTDTVSNILECQKIANTMGFQRVGIVSSSNHVNNAWQLAVNHHFPIKRAFAAEKVIAKIFESESPGKGAQFLKLYEDMSLLTGAYFLEVARDFMINTIDPKGDIPNFITSVTRNNLIGKKMAEFRKRVTVDSEIT